MKSKYIFAAVAALALSLTISLQARTWTSASGENKFEGDYVSSTDTSVTVKKSGRNITFKLIHLSEADRKWIKEEGEPAAEKLKKEAAKGTLKNQKIGKKLIGKTVKLIDNKYVVTDSEKVPEYYFLYFSAST